MITTINPPTPAVRAYARLQGFEVTVVADLGTPTDWGLPGVEMLHVDRQANLPYRIVGRLPSNHYCRQVLGYLTAVSGGARTIVDTDDDNSPLPHYGFPTWDEGREVTDPDSGFINPYDMFGTHGVWPRGMPLDSLQTHDEDQALTPGRPRVGVWQGLVDGDPDVDAIFRLTDNSAPVSSSRPPLVLGRGTIAPFNSQNTAFRRELFALLYLPTTVTFRFTDILRSFVAQPILWRFGYQLGFCSPTVVQHRNDHDYFQDFISEVPMYLSTRRAVEVARRDTADADSVSDALVAAYRGLAREGIVGPAEVEVVQAWIDDVVSLEAESHR